MGAEQPAASPRPGHHHAHQSPTVARTAAHAQRRRLAAVAAIGLAILAVEVVGAAMTGSLALLADAGHVATDVTGVGFALLAVWLAARPPTSQRTFGWQRLEVVAAAVNALLLLGIGGLVLVEAVRRLVHPTPVAGGAMVAFAAVALAGNLVAVWLLAAGQRASLTVRGAFLEVVGDALGTAGVLLAAAVVALTGWERADAVASVAVGLLILPRAAGLLREAGAVLLEATPRGVDLGEVRAHVAGVPGVVEVHDLHAWTIASGVLVLSAHVVVDDSVLTGAGVGPVLDRLQDCLGEHFDIAHSTLQIEPVGHAGHEAAGHP